MKRFITFLFVVSLFITSVTFAQNNSIFDSPHELNFDKWMAKFPHSFVPLNPPGNNPEIITDFLNVDISNDPAPQNEPSVKISRTDPNRVLAAWRDFRTGVNPPLRRVGVSLSTDGGETWSVSELLPQIIPGVPLGSDPAVAVDLDGNFYVVTVSLNESNGNGELWVFKSTDAGETFDQVYSIAGSPSTFEDKEYVTTDLNPSSPYANTLYVSWTRFASGTNILMEHSTDGGVTWSSPVNVSDASLLGVQGSVPAVGPNGEVYVIWYGVSSGGTENMYFDKSTDGGVTFGTDIVVSPSPNAWFPSIAVDLSGGPWNGNIYATWNDGRNGDDDVFFSYSSDGGDTWLDPPLRINNDPIGNGKIQYWPWITVSENGEISIIFYDTRNTANNTFIEAYLARSTDGGQTFTNELVSSEPSPTSVPNGDVRFGDYIGIDSYGGHTVPVWTDERAGGFDMDIYTAVINPILPVELTNFNAKIVNGKTILEWSTATETNNFGFEIERNAPLNPPEGGTFGNWITIGFVKGNGTTTERQDYSFIDEGLGGTVYYRLKQLDYDGTFGYSDVIEVNSVNVNTIELAQNYPNPFNPTTNIKFQIGNDGFVSLIVYNSLGEKVKTLVDEFKSAGSYQITFNAIDLPSGIYVYNLKAGNYIQSKKMILLK